MQIKYKGILLFVKIHKDNDLFIKFLSDTDELISGIVYGGLSKNKKSILQKGFYLKFDVIFKNNKPPLINPELSKPYISSIINDKYKLNCLLSSTSLINLSIIEGQKINNIYKIFNDFITKMYQNKKWLKEYCKFLFELLKIIGYEIDYLNNINKKYFDLDKLQFSHTRSISSIEFPFGMLIQDNSSIEQVEVNYIFKVFETIFVKNHLSNFNLHLPNHYHLFKKLILQRLNKKNE